MRRCIVRAILFVVVKSKNVEIYMKGKRERYLKSEYTINIYI